jgi:cell division protein ZapA (FtsZ GTPase activity inhibitor)
MTNSRRLKVMLGLTLLHELLKLFKKCDEAKNTRHNQLLQRFFLILALNQVYLIFGLSQNFGDNSKIFNTLESFGP